MKSLSNHYSSRVHDQVLIFGAYECYIYKHYFVQVWYQSHFPEKSYDQSNIGPKWSKCGPGPLLRPLGSFLGVNQDWLHVLSNSIGDNV